MASSKLDMISRGLLLIGEKPLNDLNEARVAATVASNIYDSTYEAALTTTRWRFAVGKQQLSRLVETPLNDWTFAFQLPAGMLMPIRVYPDSQYEIYENKLYSDLTALDLDYVYKPAESRLPPYFVKAMEYELATQFSIAVTDNRSLYDLYRGEADMAWKKARFADAQGRPSVPFTKNPFVDVRR